MDLVSYTSDDPRRQLACEEALLRAAVDGRAGETLRLYEMPRPSVVLGIGLEWRRGANADACGADGVPILRRCSGGGAVLLGPGCLCYSAVLSIERRPALRSIRGTYASVLGRIAQTLKARGLPVTPAGTSDLALAGRKVGGSAQKRARRHVLFHGTLLHAAEADLLDRYLPHPSAEPPYRAGRPHETFVANLPLAPGEIRPALCEAFGAAASDSTPLPDGLDADVDALMQSRYAREEWHRRR